MNDEELEAVNRWFHELGLDEEATEDITLVGNTRYRDEINPFRHEWDDVFSHLWDEDPFIGEEWMRYDPCEGF